MPDLGGALQLLLSLDVMAAIVTGTRYFGIVVSTMPASALCWRSP